jgi:hypothetical protein
MGMEIEIRRSFVFRNAIGCRAEHKEGGLSIKWTKQELEDSIKFTRDGSHEFGTLNFELYAEDSYHVPEGLSISPSKPISRSGSRSPFITSSEKLG